MNNNKATREWRRRAAHESDCNTEVRRLRAELRLARCAQRRAIAETKEARDRLTPEEIQAALREEP